MNTPSNTPISPERVKQLVAKVERIRTQARRRNDEGATPIEAMDILSDRDKSITSDELTAVEDWYEAN